MRSEENQRRDPLRRSRRSNPSSFVIRRQNRSRVELSEIIEAVRTYNRVPRRARATRFESTRGFNSKSKTRHSSGWFPVEDSSPSVANGPATRGGPAGEWEAVASRDAHWESRPSRASRFLGNVNKVQNTREETAREISQRDYVSINRAFRTVSRGLARDRRERSEPWTPTG